MERSQKIQKTLLEQQKELNVYLFDELQSNKLQDTYKELDDDQFFYDGGSLQNFEFQNTPLNDSQQNLQQEEQLQINENEDKLQNEDSLISYHYDNSNDLHKNIFQFNNELKPQEEYGYDEFINKNYNNGNLVKNTYINGTTSEKINHNSPSLNYQDSDRSNFTQESCSTPDSMLEEQKQQQKPLKLDDLNQKNNYQNNFQKDSKNSSIIQDKDDSNSNSEQFSLMHHQSAGKESLLHSFQGQFTSNFPNNLKDSSFLKLRDGSGNESPQKDQQFNSDRESQSNNFNENDKFNGSFFKFEGQKIKDFEKSTLIRFEEFEGGDSQHSDQNMKYSEGISDRIYERSEAIKPITVFTSLDDAQQDDQSHPFQNSPIYNNDKQLPLFIITEEENSEIQSSYQTFHRIQSICSSQQDKQGQTQNGDFIKLNQDQNQQQLNSQSKDQFYQKSKSQPLKHRTHSHKGYNRLSYLQNNSSNDGIIITNPNGDNQILRTDSSPVGMNQSNSPQFKDARNEAIDRSRFSTESPLMINNSSSNNNNNYDNDQMSSYFQKMQTHMHQRAYTQNVTNPDLIMSDEDLLSNIDRVSKILPTNEISEDDQKQMREEDFNNNTLSLPSHQKIKDYKQIIDHLKCENQNKQTLILIKESQLNLLQLKNEQLEDKILELQHEIQFIHELRKPLMSDQQTQTIGSIIYTSNNININNNYNKGDISNRANEGKSNDDTSDKKRIRRKSKPLSNNNTNNLNSVMKKPQSSLMGGTDVIQEQNFGQYVNFLSKQSSLNSNVFDTPQIKLDKFMKESPKTNAKMSQNMLTKINSISFNSDEVGNFKQHIAIVKSQLQRSEENNLTLQLKIEKQKKDKQSLKDQIFKLSLDKNDLNKEIEIEKKEHEMSLKKIEALNVDIYDFKKQIEILELKCKIRSTMVERSTSTSSFNLSFDQGIQTDLIYNNYHKRFDSLITIDDRDQQQIFQNQQLQLIQKNNTMRLEEINKDNDDINKFDNNHLNISDSFSTKSLANNNNINNTITQTNVHTTTTFNQNNNNAFIPQHQSQKKGQNQQQLQNITIINNKQELQLLLLKARDYEQMSLQLQNEIAEHRKILRENQERVMQNFQELKDSRRRIKKRDHRIAKMKQENAQLMKENAELKVKLQESEQKLIDLKMKMDNKINEREFKINSLKNQIKYFTTIDAFSPATPNKNNNNNNFQFQNQIDLFNMINQIVQQQINYNHQNTDNLQSVSTENFFRQRPKSTDHLSKMRNFANFSDQDNQPIIHDNARTASLQNRKNLQANKIFYNLEENQSFSNNLINNAAFFSNAPSENQRKINQPKSQTNKYKRTEPFMQEHDMIDESEIQHIFNTSMRRINIELESIKDINNNFSSSNQNQNSINNTINNTSNLLNKIQQLQQQQLQQQQIERIIPQQQQQVFEYQRAIKNISADQYMNIIEERKSNDTYDDSLQSRQAPERDNKTYSVNSNHFKFQNQNAELSSDISNIQLQMPDINNDNDTQRNMRNAQFSFKNHQINPQYIHANQIKDQKINQKNFQTLIDPKTQQFNEQDLAQEQQSFSNTIVKDQSASIQLDYKPAFEESNFINYSNINTLNNKQRKIHSNNKNQINRFESQAQSLNNSLKAHIGLSAMKLQQTTQQNNQNKLATISNTSPILMQDKHIKLPKAKIREVQKYTDDNIDQVDKISRGNNYNNNNNVIGTINSAMSSGRRYKSIGNSQQKDIRLINTPVTAAGSKAGGYIVDQVQHSTQMNYEEMQGYQNFKDEISQIPIQFTPQQLIQKQRSRENNYQLLYQQSNATVDGSKSTLSNYSQKLDDLRKRYGRINDQ